MSFIAGMYALYMSNEESFWMFVYLFEKRGMLVYFKEPETIERYSFIFMELLKKYMGKLHAHLVDCLIFR